MKKYYKLARENAERRLEEFKEEKKEARRIQGEESEREVEVLEEYEDDGGESGKVYGGEAREGYRPLLQAEKVLRCWDPRSL